MKKSKGKTLSKSGKGKTAPDWSCPLFRNHMQFNTGAMLVPSRTPDFPWETESSRKREECPLYREQKEATGAPKARVKVVGQTGKGTQSGYARSCALFCQVLHKSSCTFGQ